MKAQAARSQADTMFFGIGAQKAGTTWLWDYLSAHPEVSMGPLKEYHYFSHFHRRLGRGGRSLALGRLRRRLALASVLRRAEPGLGRWRSFWQARGGRNAYLRLVRGEKGDARAFGDITPVYSLLDRRAFAEMAACHPESRFIFIMRDPVARLWSQLCMRARDTGLPANARDPRFAAMVAEYSQRPDYLGRSDYARTITELDAAVRRERIACFFYETLFEDGEIARLTDFLGLSFVPADFSRRVHSGRAVEMPEDWRAAMRVRFDEVYRFAAARFGDRLPAAWNAEGGNRSGAGERSGTGEWVGTGEAENERAAAARRGGLVKRLAAGAGTGPAVRMVEG